MRVARKTFKPRARRAARRTFKRTAITRRRQRRRGKPFYTVSRWKAPLGNFPNSKTVALRYVDTISLNGGAGSSAVQVFRVNNIFDPDYTGTGHQPMYRDNYAALYSKYRVNYATITMVALDTHMTNTTIGNDTAGTTLTATQYFAANERACRMFIIRDASPTDYSTSLNTLIEEGNTNFVWRYNPQTASGKMPILRFRADPHRLLSCSKKDVLLNSNMSEGPNSECYFVCGVTDLGSSGQNPDQMAFQFIITYNVTFFDLLKNQAQN